MVGSQPTSPMPSEPAIKVSKYIWRVFLIFNFALGGYMFAQAHASKKERAKERTVPAQEETSAKVAPPPVAETVPAQEEEPVFSPPITKPQVVGEPIPEDQQREIFKWMLEEKRKVKPHNREEKKRIDEEKAILKEFIRSTSIPKI